MRFLRSNTATRVTVGPFLDKTDGITPEVALTVTSCKLTLMVDDGGVPTLVLDVAPTASGGANDMVHVTGDDSGYYDLELAAANVNYVGRAHLSINDVAVHCPVFHEFMILPAHVYDGLTVATGAAPIFGVIDQGTLQSATATTAVIRAAAAFGDDILNGATIVITGGTGAGQRRLITDFVGATDTCTVDTWGTNPDNTSTYIIFGSAPASTSVPSPVDVTKWLGTAVATPTVAGVPEVDVTHNAGTAITAAAGIQEVKVASAAANSLTASALATDAVNEIVAAIFARTYEATKMSGLTFEELTAMMASALLSKASGLGTATAVFRNVGDSANAISATVDADGNRSAVTLTLASVR